MEKTIEIPEGYEARIGGNKVILEKKESEDERIRRELVQYIKDYPNIPNGQYSRSDFFAYLERQKEQKPAEWSEVDKIHLMNAICAAEKKWGIDSCTANWLKSLRPSWKPSEAQMEALKDAFRKDGGNEYRKVINSLYRDLEKLL